MGKNYKEKIIKAFRLTSYFFKAHLPEIVFVVFVLQLLLSLNALPYLNILNQYYYYVTAVVWVLLNILFRDYLTNRKILVIGVVNFIFAIPFTVLGLNLIAESFGFMAFLLLFTYLLREVNYQRKFLKVD